MHTSHINCITAVRCDPLRLDKTLQCNPIHLGPPHYQISSWISWYPKNVYWHAGFDRIQGQNIPICINHSDWYVANFLAITLFCINIKTVLHVLQKLQCNPIHICPISVFHSLRLPCSRRMCIGMMTNGVDSLQGQNLPPCITEIDFLYPIQRQQILHE